MNRFYKFTICILWALLIWRLTTTPQPVILTDPWYQHLLMTGAHFLFFGIQAVLLNLSCFSRNDSLILASLYGAVIEGFQLNIPGRSADPIDWLLDTLGALVFLSLFRKFRNCGLNIV